MAFEDAFLKGLQIDFELAYKLFETVGPAIIRAISVDRDSKKKNQFHRDEAQVVAAIIMCLKLYRYNNETEA